MNTKRVEEIQKSTAHPESHSVAQALLTVWNETVRDCIKVTIPPTPPPGPPLRTFGLFLETKESKLKRIKYQAFMDGYNFALTGKKTNLNIEYP